MWDDHLSYLLSAALSAYELERCTGVLCGNEEFQDAVRRAVPDGHTFKGFPIHFLHRNARRAFATCLRYLHKQTELPIMPFLLICHLKQKPF